MKDVKKICKVRPYGSDILLWPNDNYFKAMKKVNPEERSDKIFKGLALEAEEAKKELVMEVASISKAGEKNEDFPRVGDMVLFKNGCVFEEIKIDGEVYILVAFHKIAGVLDK